MAQNFFFSKLSLLIHVNLCFSNSWETILSKSSETVSDVELRICRRVVQLCKDCLLIVYQFAHDAAIATVSNPAPPPQPTYTQVEHIKHPLLHTSGSAPTYSLTHRPPHYAAPAFHNPHNTTVTVVSHNDTQSLLQNNLSNNNNTSNGPNKLKSLNIISSSTFKSTSIVTSQPKVRFSDQPAQPTALNSKQYPQHVPLNIDDLPKR